MLSGVENSQENYLLEESLSEDVLDEYNDEDQLEYVELDNNQEQEKAKKQLYMQDDEYISEEPETYASNSDKVQSLPNKPASKRPIERAKETLDIEPIDQKDSTPNKVSPKDPEIDDPW